MRALLLGTLAAAFLASPASAFDVPLYRLFVFGADGRGDIKASNPWEDLSLEECVKKLDHLHLKRHWHADCVPIVVSREIS